MLKNLLKTKFGIVLTTVLIFAGKNWRGKAKWVPFSIQIYTLICFFFCCCAAASVSSSPQTVPFGGTFHFRLCYLWVMSTYAHWVKFQGTGSARENMFFKRQRDYKWWRINTMWLNEWKFPKARISFLFSPNVVVFFSCFHIRNWHILLWICDVTAHTHCPAKKHRP